MSGRNPHDPENLAFVGLKELEDALRHQPPPGVTGEEVSALMRRNWQPLMDRLVALLRDAAAERIGWIVLARVEQQQPVALLWAQDASEAERLEARNFADKEGYMLFTYPASESESLHRAKEDVFTRLTGDADRALRSLRPPRVARLHKIAAAGEAGFAPHREADRGKLAAWTRELELFKRWGLVSYNGRWRVTALGRRVVELALEKDPTAPVLPPLPSFRSRQVS